MGQNLLNPMKITVNKKNQEFPQGSSVLHLINEMKLAPEKTLVSVNNEIISQVDFADTILQENDDIELFAFVGGG